MLERRRRCSVRSDHPAAHLGGEMGARREAHQRFGEDRIGVHRHRTRAVVEDIRLGEVVERGPVTKSDRGGELATAEAIEEVEGGHEPADRDGTEAGGRRHDAVHLGGREPHVGEALWRACHGQSLDSGWYAVRRLQDTLKSKRGRGPVAREGLGLVGWLATALATRLPDAKSGAGRQTGPALRPAWWGNHPPAPYFTVFTMSKIGRYIATIMPPTTTPRNTIMIGSSSESSALTAASTSSS
jgi:hypothetical protein